MKFKTVREGEQAVIFNHLGEGRLVVGPQRVFLYRETLQKLRQYTATSDEYLVIRKNTGHVTHEPGPCSTFLNPLEHENIRVLSSIHIDANHLIVVYRRVKADNVERRIVQGPTLFVPSADEWLHEFSWHGTDSSNKTRMIPGHNKFTQLDVIPNQFYYNVREVRTIDDTMITVKLMLFYELEDVIKMLETTHDPIADMINAVCADVIAFAGKLTYEGFLKIAEKLGLLETYPQLMQRANRIGYRISKVVYRGYHASEQLQAMQDAAVKSRTELRLNAELAKQQQTLVDFKLKKEQERTKLKQEIEKRKQEHHHQVAALKQKHELEQKEGEQQAQRGMDDQWTRAKLESKADRKQEEVNYLQQLQSLDVDMTQYLVNQQHAQIAEEIQVVTAANKTPNTSL